jgi:hypothetical protein
MTMANIDQYGIDDHFDAYFNKVENYSLRSERLFDDLGKSESEIERFAIVEKWMRSAFRAGFCAGAGESVYTLRVYGTALEGIETPTRTLSEGYDHSAENLEAYFKTLFDEE